MSSLEERASCLSRHATLWYLNPLLRIGTTRPLTLDDLGPLNRIDDADFVFERFEREWGAEVARAAVEEPAGGKPPRLLLALFRAAGWRTLLGSWFLMGCSSFLQLALPLLTKVALQYVSGEVALTSVERGLLAFAGAATLVGGTALNAFPLVVMNRAGVQMRVALSVAIYRKALRCSSRGREGQSTGQVVTLMSADASMFEQFMMQIPHIVTALPLTVMCFVLVYAQIGNSAWVFWGFLVVLLPLFIIVFGVLRQLQKQLMGVTESRIKLLNDVIAGIRALKANSWEVPFEEKVLERREAELGIVRKMAYWYCVGMNSVFIAAPELQMLAVLVAYWALDGSFQPSRIFPTLMLFSVIREPMGALAQSAVSVSQAIVSGRRIGAFLQSDEVQLLEGDVRDRTAAPAGGTLDALSMAGCEFVWTSPASASDAAGATGACSASVGNDAALKAPAAASELESVLEESVAEHEKEGQGEQAAELKDQQEEEGGGEDATEDGGHKPPFALTVEDVHVAPGQLVAIVGAVGAGKSTFLQAALGETAKRSGRVALRGAVSFAAQTPFVMNTSLKENILFGKPLVEHKYARVLEACALLPDLEQLPGGDATEIGERGITISGGQKARVSIARAAYSGADVVLLDDPLSAVDAHVAETLFNDCVRGLLAGKTRLLVTNQLQHLEKCDRILVIDGARVAEQGTYDELRALGEASAFARLMSATVQEGTEEEGEEGAEDVGAVGRLSRISDVGSSSPRPTAETQKVAAEGVEDVNKKSGGGGMEVEERLTGKHLFSLVRYYLRAAGPRLMGASLVTTLLQSALMSSGVFILGAWGDEVLAAQRETVSAGGTATGGALGRGRCRWWITLFGVTKALYLGAIIFNAVLLAEGRVHAARALHRDALAAVVRAPVWWFDVTPIGRVLNRFSGDITSIDNNCMIMFGWLTLTSAMLFFIVASVLLATKGTMLVVIVPIMLAFRRVLEFVRCSTTAVKRMESTTKSPVFSSFSEALVGIATIRAYAQEARFQRTNVGMINVNTGPTLVSRRVSIWLSFQLGVMAALLNCATLTLVLALPDLLSPGAAGVALGFAGSVLKTMQHVCQLTAQFEVDLNSVERLRHYCTELPCEQYEAEKEVALPSKGGAGYNTHKAEEDVSVAARPWRCTEGAIRFDAVACRYRDGPLVLHSVDFSVAPREKVGIVGRTGSGKSTILATLFRIVELERGAIRIDGVDIATLPLASLRMALCIVPQDPVLFGESVRFNLDPFGSFDDAAIWAALLAVQLHAYIKELPGALEHVVEEGGANFSVGQRQLICIARALLRQPRLLVLDEATASVDQQTDAILQNMIRAHFADATVLTVAHRLKTIMDSDRVLVLDGGRVAEFAPPRELLLRDAGEGGIFAGMVDAHGESAAAALRAQVFLAGDAEQLSHNIPLACDMQHSRGE